MNNADVISLRREYHTLILVSEGLVDAINEHGACNVSTIARMAQEARTVAHKIASMIERLLTDIHESATPKSESAPKRESLIRQVFTRLKEAIVALVAKK